MGKRLAHQQHGDMSGCGLEPHVLATARQEPTWSDVYMPPLVFSNDVETMSFSIIPLQPNGCCKHKQTFVVHCAHKDFRHKLFSWCYNKGEWKPSNPDLIMVGTDAEWGEITAHSHQKSKLRVVDGGYGRPFVPVVQCSEGGCFLSQSDFFPASTA